MDGVEKMKNLQLQVLATFLSLLILRICGFFLRLPLLLCYFFLQFQSKVKEVYKLYDCQPWKTFLLPFTQLPLFIAVSFSLRRMAAFPLPFFETPPSPVPGFNTEGMLWFIDLAAPDPTLCCRCLSGFFILPILR
ncbi:hypothetical protein BC829DRAFT_26764 [Chytridium lagenaria]|nr:hypothetical protein BC829DRAFT_26764 [Chytridium lagenaria]